VVFFNHGDLAFDVGSSTVANRADDALNDVIAAIKGHLPEGVVQVRGHTDATGSADLNQRLSEDRARAIKDYLGTHGLDPTKIASVGLGSTTPLVEERNPDGSENPNGRQDNRRVEVVVRSP
jgi:outer membrane protein OmpA-like peptidoglycan-associated protein